MKGNVHSSGYELKTRPWSHSGESTSLNKEIDCSSALLAHPAVTFWEGLDEVSDFDELDELFLHVFPHLFGPPAANQLVKQRRRPTCCRRCGVIRIWGTLWPRTAGTRATSRYSCLMLWKLPVTNIMDPKYFYCNIKFLKEYYLNI